MPSHSSEFSECVNQFSIDIYKAVTEESPSSNVFMSASSVLVAMAMVQTGARGETLQQMNNTLRFNGLKKKTPQEHVQEYLERVNKTDRSCTLNSANRIYPHSDGTIFENYKQEVANYFGTDMRSLDYTTQSEESRKEINDWVEAQTKGKIKDLLAQGTITPLVKMVVVNAIYFNAQWANIFDKYNTKGASFYCLDNTTINVDMMEDTFQDVNIGRSRRLAAKVLELPYKGKEISMMIILPSENDGLPALERKLSLKDMGEILSGSIFDTDNVKVSLPKFRIEDSHVLNKTLASLGMPDVFDEDHADLSGMSDAQLYVSLVVQKAFVDVNEVGTEAAASTAAVENDRCLPERFRADHPFLFLIVHKGLGLPLFMGRLVAPPVSQQPDRGHKRRGHSSDRHGRSSKWRY